MTIGLNGGFGRLRRWSSLVTFGPKMVINLSSGTARELPHPVLFENRIVVIESLADLFLSRGLPTYIRSDNGPEFTAKAVREWLGRLEVVLLFIEPGSPWENGYVESRPIRK